MKALTRMPVAAIAATVSPSMGCGRSGDGRLPQDRPDGGHQQQRVDERGENGRAAQAIGARRGRPGLRHRRRAPGEQQTGDVRQIVTRIGQQGEASRSASPQAASSATKAALSATPRAKARPEIRRGVGVAMVVIVHSGRTFAAGGSSLTLDRRRGAVQSPRRFLARSARAGVANVGLLLGHPRGGIETGRGAKCQRRRRSTWRTGSARTAASWCRRRPPPQRWWRPEGRSRPTPRTGQDRHLVGNRDRSVARAISWTGS